MIKAPVSECTVKPQFLLWNASRSIERLGGQEALIVKLVTLYLRDAPVQIEQALSGIEHKDYESSHIAIHSLKGTSSNFCTKKLELICDELLVSLKALNWDESLKIHARLLGEYSKLGLELERFVK